MDTRVRLKGLNEGLNWDMNREPQCRSCSFVDERLAGSYAGCLEDYEDLLGPLPRPRSKARLLVLFQDPPPRPQDLFNIVPPGTAPSSLKGRQHGYFCLSPLAWAKLNLNRLTGSEKPVWPTEETASCFLQMYRGGGGQRFYDGLVAYMLFRFSAEAALITNLAKCHFSKGRTDAAIEKCIEIHLPNEIELVEPNVVIGFGKNLAAPLKKAGVVGEGVAFLSLYHPAATFYQGAVRATEFKNEVHRNSKRIQNLGLDPRRLVEQFARDFEHRGG